MWSLCFKVRGILTGIWFRVKFVSNNCIWIVSIWRIYCFSFVWDNVDRLFADSPQSTCKQSQPVRIQEIGDNLRKINVDLKIKYSFFYFPTKWKTRIRETSSIVVCLDCKCERDCWQERGLRTFCQPLSVTCTACFVAGLRHDCLHRENVNTSAKELTVYMCDWRITTPSSVEVSNVFWV